MSASLASVLDRARVVSVPMRVRFRGITHREVVLVRGPAGWGEWGPFVEYGPREAARWLDAAVEAAYVGWPEPRRDTIPVNATVPAVAAAEVPALLDRYDGVGTVKVKVAEAGQSLADDECRVRTVREHLPSALIRVDANGGWDVEQARDALGRLAAFGLEYAEQPCATVEELRDLRISLARNGIDVPVAADESIRKAEDPLRVAREGAADLVVVKVAPLGGVRRALEIVGDAGLPAVVSSAIDTSVGIRAGLALAAALPELPHACGLSTVRLMAGDVTADSLVARGGRIALRDVDVDDELLERWAAPPERQDWWRRRLVAAAPYCTAVHS